MDFLLTDDNEITLEIEKTMLESCGLTVVTADCGTSAVKLASEQHFRMVFMDIHMPDMNGFQAAEAIRELDPDVPIIALSADKIFPDDPDLIRSGMNGSLLKPLHLNELKEVLGRFLTNVRTDDSEEYDSDVLFSSDELMNVLHDEKAVFSILSRFLSVHGDDCTMLSHFVSNNDFLPAREILHNIIGISGNLFCHPLYRAACVLSGELKKNSAASLGEFTDIWKATLKEIADFRSTISETGESAASVSWDSLRAGFLSLCEDFDVTAADIFSENLRTFEENMPPDKFEWLRNAVLRYDFMSIADNTEVF